jgi:hypothetical protein
MCRLRRSEIPGGCLTGPFPAPGQTLPPPPLATAAEGGVAAQRLAARRRGLLVELDWGNHWAEDWAALLVELLAQLSEGR